MALCLQSALPVPVPSEHQVSSRKRTSSFSSPSPSLSPNPRPAKQQRTSSVPSTKDMGLRRTESFLLLPETMGTRTTATLTFSTSPSSSNGSGIPYNKSLQYYKDQRQAQKKAIQQSWVEPISIRTRVDVQSPASSSQSRQTPIRSQKKDKLQAPPKPTPAPTSTPKLIPPPKQYQPNPRRPSPSAKSQPILPAVRTTSPLSPTRKSLPSRPCFPRSKPDVDLLKKAVTACMRQSPSGQQILRMGARNAISVLSATRDLERMIAEQDDVVMSDVSDGVEKNREGVKEEEGKEAMGNSWVVVKGTSASTTSGSGQQEDWEMLDCTSTAV